MNVLLDTLIRPHGETDDTIDYTCISWEHRPDLAVDHVAIGDAHCAGGQWVDNPVAASWDIETLSYAGMLSLPGYSFAEHHVRTHGADLPPFQRPSRREVATYLAEYPEQVGIEDSFYYSQKLAGISRTENGFFVESHGISCRHLVLASGIFSHLIPARPLLQPLSTLSKTEKAVSTAPLLVIGSGFSAADVILSTPKERKIIHIYKWAPKTSPSPLRGCHQQAYPEYAGIYRRMKSAAISRTRPTSIRPKMRKISSSVFDVSREWKDIYEGYPNTVVIDVNVHGDTAVVTFQPEDGPSFTREISELAYVVGRRGSLSYLSQTLQTEVCGSPSDAVVISGQTLRQKALISTEVSDNIFIIGSMTGDSLVRFSYGGCVFAAGQIMDRYKRRQDDSENCIRRLGRDDEKVHSSGSSASASGTSSPSNNRTRNQSSTGSSSPFQNEDDNGNVTRAHRPVPEVRLMSGLEGHNHSSTASQ